jgi:MFS transporter, ACS family, glucarate transporter
MNRNSTPLRMVILLFATATAGYICRVNISTAAPLLMKEYGLSQAAMGRVFSAFLLGYALFQVPSGVLADKWGTRSLLGIAAWFWAGLTLLQTGLGWGPLALSSGTALVFFLVTRFFLGISASPTYPASAKGVSRWVPSTLQGRANGLVIASVGLGSALAPPLVSQVMVAWGWRPALMLTAIPALLIAVIWRRISEPNDRTLGSEVRYIESPANSQIANQGSLKSSGFILLTISYSLQGYVGYIFVAWFYLYLVQVRHFGLLTGGWVSSLPWILSIISMPLGGYFSDRLSSGRLGLVWGSRIIPLGGLALSGILISVGAHTDNAVVAAITLAFATAFVLCVEGPFWTVMTRFAGPKSGRAGGIMNMGSNLGGLLSPALTPWLAGFIGWENALHLAAILALLAASFWFWISPPIPPTYQT